MSTPQKDLTVNSTGNISMSALRDINMQSAYADLRLAARESHHILT